VKQPRIVVVGTGTGIGKTSAGESLLKALAGLHVPATGLKPVESGIGHAVTDSGRLAGASSMPPRSPPPYAFEDAVSPHLAARRVGSTITLARIVQWVDTHSDRALLIETAGALLSPLGVGLTNLHLARALRPDVLVLVAPDRLGVLHEVSSALLALRAVAEELPVPIVMLQPPVEADSSTGTNAAELVALGIVHRAWSLKWAADPALNAPIAESALRAVGCFT
jgi:dethiobiotin synthetase